MDENFFVLIMQKNETCISISSAQTASLMYASTEAMVRMVRSGVIPRAGQIKIIESGCCGFK